MATQLNRKRVYEPPPIPDRLYFKIGDVAELCGVETYVLRFWESQFPLLKPNKSGTGQRLYRRRDVEMALEIKRLVHAEGYTLPARARCSIRNSAAPANASNPKPLCRCLQVATSVSMEWPPSSVTPAPSCANWFSGWRLRPSNPRVAAAA